MALLVEHEYFRWYVAIGILPIAAIEKTIRPEKPDGIPTPIATIESSPTWKFVFACYTLAAVALALLSIANEGVASWLENNIWILFPSILGIIAGPVIHSEIVHFRAYHEDRH